MRVVLVVLMCAAMARTQQPEAQISDVETAVIGRDLESAYDAAAKLDDTVQAMLRASLRRNAGSIADQVLTWIPPSWDAFVFDQRAFTVSERVSRADAAVFVNRLARLRGGAVLDALRGFTVRAAAMAGSAHFYFFDANATARVFGEPDLTILGRPFWRGDADAWFTLARPDLLVVAGSRDLAAAIVGRVLNGSNTRALPADLAVWKEVDRAAPLWGLNRRMAIRFDETRPDTLGTALAMLGFGDLK